MSNAEHLRPKDPYVLQVNEAVAYIRGRIAETSTPFQPYATITLGSGLGKLADLVRPIMTIPYQDIPYFPIPTVKGHEGTLIVGYLEGVPIICFKGRTHFYEVADQPDSMDRIAFAVQVAASLGTRLYIAANAAGGLHTKYKVGDLMLMSSHIDTFLPGPYVIPYHNFGENPFFQPQNEIYPLRLRQLFRRGQGKTLLYIHEGSYAALPGRQYEANAVAKMLRKLGVRAVGMSSVPEVIVATNRGLDTFGVSIISNIIKGDGTNATSHTEVTGVLDDCLVRERVTQAFRTFFRNLRHELDNQPHNSFTAAYSVSLV